MGIKFSHYKNKEALANNELDLSNYIGFVKTGSNEDDVLNARAALEKGDEAEYKRIKTSTQAITGSCIFESGKSKIAKNVKDTNGLIVLDIDQEISNETYYAIRSDPYTFILHRSFSGKNFCVFVKINSDKFENSFMGLGEYYFNTFGVTIDPSCKNINRLRFVSYDPDIYVCEKSTKFIPKDVKRFAEPKEVDYIFHTDDFDNILKQISEKHTDLCQEDYARYVRIGMSIASHFGDSGLDKFKFICQFGGKYNEKKAERDYKGFVANSEGKSSIGTFYYFAKEAGLEVYGEKTKAIINKVKIGKSQGKPTIDSIASNLKVANDISITSEDEDLISMLIASNIDFSVLANAGVTDIEQLISFIVESYQPTKDALTGNIYVLGGQKMEDKHVNDIYLTCKKSFEFNVAMADVKSILGSSSVSEIDRLADFFKKYDVKEYRGYIDEYISCIHPVCEFNAWAFKKWIVGAIHNWTASEFDDRVSPLTLVLTGQKHGIGKTSFLRAILPNELKQYFTQGKLDSHDKDSVYRMATSLIVFDDEFGGTAVKDVKAYKALSDIDKITMRRPYERADRDFRRRAQLCGSSNENDIKKDVTGERRILPINVERTEYDRFMKIDKIGLIMEAYQLYRNGFDWILRTDDDVKYLKDSTEQNDSVMVVEELFDGLFSLEPNGLHSWAVIFTKAEVLNFLLIWSPYKVTKFEVSDLFVKRRLVTKNNKEPFTGKQKQGIKLYIEQSKVQVI